jgi:hypothetical protein
MDYDASSTRCFTLKAAMDVQYRGSTGESNLIEDYVQSIVHNRIAIDSTQLYVMDVIGLQWSKPAHIPEEMHVEETTPRDNTLPPNVESPKLPPTVVSSTSSSASLSRFGHIEIVIPVVTGVFLILLWIGAHFYRRHILKKQNNRKTASLKQASKENGIDVETGSVKTAPTISPTNSGPELHTLSEIDSVDSGTPSKDRSGWVAVSSPLPPQTPPTSQKNNYGADISAISKSMPVSVDSPERYKQDGGATAIFKSLPVSVDSPDRSAAGLPPRPPRRNSMKLKKRRKRKKKKKVAALKRVNSRENINEMPVISESEDEESERGSECDSEYTSDDESSCSYDASSGCMTPCHSRSQSRTSSRASSPQLSPQDESFAANVFDHEVEFVIEAPDFPNLLDREENDSPRNPFLPSCMLSRKSHPGEQQQRALEIEPRSNDSMVDENDSPKRRLPLPWLN